MVLSHLSHRFGESIITKEPRNISFRGSPSLKVWGDSLWLRLGRRAKQQRLIYLPSMPPYVRMHTCACVSKLLELTKSLSTA